MAGVKELIRTEDNNTISFGDYELTQKSKLTGYEFNGDIYKVKTYDEITKLEKNDMFVYESVPGTAVTYFQVTEDGVSFTVEGDKDAQITLELEDNTEYLVKINGEKAGFIESNMSGKLTFSVELENVDKVDVEIIKE
ncbi:MAG: endosialidase [Lachnospiraceae bacterium]|nr:endosialidase [Lachnospiraceae bacterium]